MPSSSSESSDSDIETPTTPELCTLPLATFSIECRNSLILAFRNKPKFHNSYRNLVLCMKAVQSNSFTDPLSQTHFLDKVLPMCIKFMLNRNSSENHSTRLHSSNDHTIISGERYIGAALTDYVEFVTTYVIGGGRANLNENLLLGLSHVFDGLQDNSYSPRFYTDYGHDQEFDVPGFSARHSYRYIMLNYSSDALAELKQGYRDCVDPEILTQDSSNYSMYNTSNFKSHNTRSGNSNNSWNSNSSVASMHTLQCVNVFMQFRGLQKLLDLFTDSPVASAVDASSGSGSGSGNDSEVEVVADPPSPQNPPPQPPSSHST